MAMLVTRLVLVPYFPSVVSSTERRGDVESDRGSSLEPSPAPTPDAGPADAPIASGVNATGDTDDGADDAAPPQLDLPGPALPPPPTPSRAPDAILSSRDREPLRHAPPLAAEAGPRLRLYVRRPM
jgi:hypothetical protein